VGGRGVGDLKIDPRDPTPLYAQIEREIVAAIATGRWQAGSQLPTVRQLAVDLRINANTVARVYRHLERSGALETRRGVGTFVVGPPTPRSGADTEVLAALGAAARIYLASAAGHGATPADALEYLKKLVSRADSPSSQGA
jgi:GntR family transcriptional regulator